MPVVPEIPEARPAKGPDRRDFLSGATLLALALGIPLGAVSLSSLDADQAPTPRQRKLLQEVGALVIPRTDTPGAGNAGVTDFVVLALAHGLLGTGVLAPGARDDATLARFVRGDGTLNHLAWLEAQLNHRAGGDFLRAHPQRQVALLTAFDADAFPAGPPSPLPSPWQAIKSLILTGYYTSEIGGAQELRYELVPGRFDPDLPLHPGDRAWSSDWTAVDFG